MHKEMKSEAKVNDVDTLDASELDLSAFDEFEKNLEDQLLLKENELKSLQKDFEQIGSSTSLGENIKAVVWEQFCNQVASVAGEDFIKENRGMTLDLRDSAHIQTTENFVKGKIATHNTEIDFKQRHENYLSNFVRDESGNVVTHTTRTGRTEPTLVPGARKPFDEGRPSGSKEKGTAMDHTISAAEQIRDPAANAHLSKEEQIAFANSQANLNEIPASWNGSKSDTPTNEWLDNPNAKGQKPDEIFDGLDEQAKQKLRDKDAKARKEWEKRKKKGEQRSIETGKKSQKAEALRVGKAELKSIIIRMLMELLKKIIQKLVSWLRSAKSGIASLIEDVKMAFVAFAKDFKTHLINAADSFGTSLATALFGPVMRVLKKIWTTLKQAWKSVKDAWNFLRDPKNAKMPFSLKMMEVGKIVVAGLAAMGAVVLGESIEAGLLAIPVVGQVLAIEIPLIGSIASLLGIFLGAVISGIVGAIVINWLQKKIESKLKGLNLGQQVAVGNKVVAITEAQAVFSRGKSEIVKSVVVMRAVDRHKKLDSRIAAMEHQRMIDDSIDPDAVNDGVAVVDERKTRLDNLNKGLKDLLED